MLHLTVRHSNAGDGRALARLAALDSAAPPTGPALIAESDGRLLAAVPLTGGRAIADPFERTADVVALLELRAAQLEPGGEGSRGGLFRRLRPALADR